MYSTSRLKKGWLSFKKKKKKVQLNIVINGTTVWLGMYKSTFMEIANHSAEGNVDLI